MERLVIVRHGESVGNVAAQRAESSGADRLDLDTPDAATPLSSTGVTQSVALGRELAGTLAPDVVISSPYRRARQTADLIVAQLPAAPPVRCDERLRDRELGILDRLTGHGVARLYPEEAERRRFLGTFYYRPPGGESWADCALRLRSFLRDGDRYTGQTVLLVAHEAIIMILRYIVEGLSVEELTALGQHRLHNAGVTSWRSSAGGLVLERYDDAGAGVPETRQVDV